MKRLATQEKILDIYPAILEVMGIVQYPEAKKRTLAIIDYFKGDDESFEPTPLYDNDDGFGLKLLLNAESTSEYTEQHVLFILTFIYTGDEYLKNKVFKLYFAEDGTEIIVDELLKLSATNRLTKENIVNAFSSLLSEYHTCSVSYLNPPHNSAVLDTRELKGKDGLTEFSKLRFDKHYKVVNDHFVNKTWSKEADDSILTLREITLRYPSLLMKMGPREVIVMLLTTYVNQLGILSDFQVGNLANVVRKTFAMRDEIESRQSKQFSVDSASSAGVLAGYIVGSYKGIRDRASVEDIRALNALFVIHKYTLNYIGFVVVETGVKHRERMELFKDIFLTPNITKTLTRFTDSLYDVELEDVIRRSEMSIEKPEEESKSTNEFLSKFSDKAREKYATLLNSL